MAPCGQQGQRDGAVVVRRHDHAHYVASPTQGFDRVERVTVMPGRDFGGAGRVCTVNPGEGDTGQFRIKAGVVLAEVADAGDAGTKGGGFGHGLFIHESPTNKHEFFVA